jgi:hypothetical protein
MPVKKCESDGKSGWGYGDVGKCYTGAGAKKKAHIQGYAIQKSQEERGEKVHKDDIQKAVTSMLSEILSGATFHNIHGLQESYNDAWYGAMKHSDLGCFKVALRGKDGHAAAKYAAVTEKVYPNEALPTMELMRKLGDALKLTVTEDVSSCPECGYRNPGPEELDKLSEAEREDAIKVKMNEEGKGVCYNKESDHEVPFEFSGRNVDIVAEMAVTTGAIAIHPGYQSSTGPRKESKPKPSEPSEPKSPSKSKSTSTGGGRGPKGPKGPGRRSLNDDIDRIAGTIPEILL